MAAATTDTQAPVGSALASILWDIRQVLVGRSTPADPNACLRRLLVSYLTPSHPGLFAKCFGDHEATAFVKERALQKLVSGSAINMRDVWGEVLLGARFDLITSHTDAMGQTHQTYPNFSRFKEELHAGLATLDIDSISEPALFLAQNVSDTEFRTEVLQMCAYEHLLQKHGVASSVPMAKYVQLAGGLLKVLTGISTHARPTNSELQLYMNNISLGQSAEADTAAHFMQMQLMSAKRVSDALAATVGSTAAKMGGGSSKAVGATATATAPAPAAATATAPAMGRPATVPLRVSRDPTPRRALSRIPTPTQSGLTSIKNRGSRLDYTLFEGFPQELVRFVQDRGLPVHSQLGTILYTYYMSTATGLLKHGIGQNDLEAIQGSALVGGGGGRNGGRESAPVEGPSAVTWMYVLDNIQQNIPYERNAIDAYRGFCKTITKNMATYETLSMTPRYKMQLFLTANMPAWEDLMVDCMGPFTVDMRDRIDEYRGRSPGLGVSECAWLMNTVFDE